MRVRRQASGLEAFSGESRFGVFGAVFVFSKRSGHKTIIVQSDPNCQKDVKK